MCDQALSHQTCDVGIRQWVCEVGPQSYRYVDVVVSECAAEAGMKNWIHVGC